MYNKTMGKYKDVPKEIEDIIDRLEPKEEFTYVVRLMRYNRDPIKDDFLPDFVDPESRFSREKMSAKGGMAEKIAKQTKKPDIYCVSLHYVTTAVEFDNFYAIMERHTPYIALGKTDVNKGEAYSDGDNHVMYFLYDYDCNSPCDDFKRIGKDEIKYGR